MKKVFSQYFILLFFLLELGTVAGQCPQFLNEAGQPANQPVFLLCSKDPRTLFVDFSRNFASYTINWGDGSPNSTGSSYTPGSLLSHSYAAGVNNFTITLTTGGCTVTATVIKEEPVTASIQVPFGGVTRACAPAVLQFINSSTNNSTNTVYIWNFGDGSPNQTFNSTNNGQTISHTYLRGSVDCGTKVTLTAYNQCNLRQGSVSVAEYSPILIWDLDKPQIGSDTLFCYPDTVVTYTNATDLNCDRPGEGNVEPRTEYWRFIDYFGPGKDSIIDWRPFGPARRIAYPGIGTYRVELRERSYCGEVSIIKTIRIIEAPVAGISADKDTICIGEPVTFRNISTGPANIFRWDPGNGSGWQTFQGTLKTVTYTQSGTYLVKLAVNVNGGSQSCKDTAVVAVVVVPDPVAAFNIPDSIGCDSLSVLFTDRSTGASSWSWTFGQGNSSTSKQPAIQQYNSPGRYAVKLTVTSQQSCVNTLVDSVWVFASPKVSFTVTDICENAPLSPVNNTVSDPADTVVTWLWDWGDGQTSGVKNPAHTFAVAGNYNISLSAQSAHCQGAATRPLLVNPLPVAVFTPDRVAGCTPLQVNFSNTSTGASTFQWDFADGNGSTQRTPQHTFVNSGGSNRTFPVRMIALSDKACSDTAWKDITVYPGATADFTFTAVNKCVSLDVTFVNASSGANSYQWDFGDSTTSQALNPTHNYTNSGVFVAEYMVRLIAISANGCRDTVIKPVSVNPEAKFGFTADPDSGCSPLVVNFTAKAGAASYSWQFPDGSSPSGTYVQKTIFNTTNQELRYKVRLTAQTSTGCTDITEKEIIVFPNPQAALQTSPAQGCSPLQVAMVNNSVGAQQYEWDYGDGTGSATTAQAHSFTYLNNSPGPLTYKVILKAISAFGCEDTAQGLIRVFPAVTAYFDTISGGCSPFSKSFTAGGGSQYQWNFGNGEISSSQNYTATYTNPGNLASAWYDVQLIATSTFGCSDTAGGRVEVYPKPLAGFSADKLQGCSPLDVTLSNTSAGAVSYLWDYGDGTGSANLSPSHQASYTNPFGSIRSYTLTLQAVSARGCRDTTTGTIEVYPDVLAAINHDTIGCDPLEVKFFNGSQGASVYAWDFGVNGSSAQQEPVSTFRNTTTTPRTYPVQLIAYSAFNCSDTVWSQVTVHPRPVAAFVLDKDRGCQPLDVSIENTSMAATSWKWEYGLGGGSSSAAQFQEKTYPNGSDSVVSYTIRQIALNQFLCGDTVEKTVTVYPAVVAAFDTILPGCSPHLVEVKNRSTGDSFVTWNFGGENTTSDPESSHTFVNPGSADQVRWVELVAENQFLCRDTVRRSFTVYAVPDARLSVTPPEQRFPAATVSFDNLTQGTWTYRWDLGNGDISTQPVPADKTFSTWGNYLITLSAFSAYCEDTVSQWIRIIPPYPVAEFDGGGEGCKPFTVSFTNETQYGVSFLWDFGDGGTSTQKDPVYTYFEPGTYTVTLTAVGPNGESDTRVRTQLIKVNDNAEAFFTYTPDEASNSDPVDFLNLSRRADSYFWDFGDGTTSEETSPTHFYTRAGVYDVVLIADNFFGCADTFRVQNAVKIVEGGSIELPTAFTPNPAGPSGGMYNPQGLTNDVFFPFHKDVEQFRMEIFSRWGEKLFESNDINIGWDGYFNGELCQQDVYVYKIEAVFKGGVAFSKVGDLTLLR